MKLAQNAPIPVSWYEIGSGYGPVNQYEIRYGYGTLILVNWYEIHSGYGPEVELSGSQKDVLNHKRASPPFSLGRPIWYHFHGIFFPEFSLHLGTINETEQVKQ